MFFCVYIYIYIYMYVCVYIYIYISMYRYIKEMATHSRILAWEIPWTEESDRLQSIGSHRVGHNWSDWTHIINFHGESGIVTFWSRELSAPLDVSKGCESLCPEELKDYGFLYCVAKKEVEARPLKWWDWWQKGWEGYVWLRSLSEFCMSS